MKTNIEQISKIESQNRQVLNWLQSGQSLTQFDAANYFGIYRLSARIFDLRKNGHKITSELIVKGSRHWSKYTLNQKP